MEPEEGRRRGGETDEDPGTGTEAGQMWHGGDDGDQECAGHHVSRPRKEVGCPEEKQRQPLCILSRTELRSLRLVADAFARPR